MNGFQCSTNDIQMCFTAQVLTSETSIVFFAVYIRFNLNVSNPLKRAWLILFQKTSVYILFFRPKTDTQNRRSGVELTLQSWAIMFGDKTTAKENTYMDFSYKFRTVEKYLLVCQFSSAAVE